MLKKTYGKIVIVSAIICMVGNAQSMEKQSTLHEAAQHGDLDSLIKILITKQARVDAQNDKGQTALMLAVQAGQVSVVDTLVHCYNARLDIKDSKKQTVLHYAAQKGKGTTKRRLYILRLLLKRGVNVNVKSTIGFTPLHNAVITSQQAIAQELVTCGSDVELEDCAGLTPLDYALVKKDIDMAIVLAANLHTIKTNKYKKFQAHVKPESPTLGRLKMTREKLMTYQLTHKEEDDAQEDSSSHEL